MANNGLSVMKNLVNSASLKERVQQTLQENPGTFLASVLELYSSDSALSQCDPNKVMAEAMKAASLRLPVNKALGFVYILPYRVKGVMTPTFILGYRGMIQLAQRTGLYRSINADCVFEGETPIFNRVTGSLEITGTATSDKAIGYFAYFELLNGFKKAVYWNRDRVMQHGNRYSKAYTMPASPWQTDFDAMACKTVLRQLLSKYGIMTVDFANAMAQDQDDRVEVQVAADANMEPITLADEAAAVHEDVPALPVAEPAPADANMEPDF